MGIDVFNGKLQIIYIRLCKILSSFVKQVYSKEKQCCYIHWKTLKSLKYVYDRNGDRNKKWNKKIFWFHMLDSKIYNEIRLLNFDVHC